jgi:hypothetical protein
MTIKSFKLARFQDRHDRIMSDNQVLEVHDHHFGRELTTNSSDLGPEIRASLSYPRPLRVEIVRTFEEEAWPGLFGTAPAWIVYRVSALRTGSMRPMSLPFNEVINHACRDLAANQAGLSLRRLQGGREPPVSIHDRPGHGLMLSKTARREHGRPEVKRPDGLPHRLNQLQLSWRTEDHGKGRPHV